MKRDGPGASTTHRHDCADDGIFLEVHPNHAQDADTPLSVAGKQQYGYQVLQVTGASIPQTIAVVVLAVHDLTGAVPRLDFAWPESSHTTHLLRFLLFGTGQVAPITREILRQAEPNTTRRPIVHIG